jgi:hypothetical protein
LNGVGVAECDLIGDGGAAGVADEVEWGMCGCEWRGRCCSVGVGEALDEGGDLLDVGDPAERCALG